MFTVRRERTCCGVGSGAELISPQVELLERLPLWFSENRGCCPLLHKRCRAVAGRAQARPRVDGEPGIVADNLPGGAEPASRVRRMAIDTLVFPTEVPSEILSTLSPAFSLTRFDGRHQPAPDLFIGKLVKQQNVASIEDVLGGLLRQCLWGRHANGKGNRALLARAGPDINAKEIVDDRGVIRTQQPKVSDVCCVNSMNGQTHAAAL